MSENNLEITTREELRTWLSDHHEGEKECWVPVSVSPKENTILYLDLVEEALCFGWIDSTKKKDSTGRLMQRISPRTLKSNWTELNKERVRRLDKLGGLTTAGRKVLPDMSAESFIIDDVILKSIQQDPQTYTHFLAQPPLYTRVRIDSIQSVRKDQELYLKRLEKFITKTKENSLYGPWHDNGRLID